MSSPISGFTAIPNPQMLAFMPIQSYLMMYFAGSGWQYGKRRISAMSNEQFNKLTPEQLLQQHSIELKNMLPTLEKTLDDVTPLIRILIEQYGEFIVEAIKVTPKVASTTGYDIGTEILKGLGTTREATGINPTQAQFLAYAKILLAQEADKAVTPPSLNLSETEKAQLITQTTLANKRTAETPIKYQNRFISQSEWDQIQVVNKQNRLIESRKATAILPQLSIAERTSAGKRKAGQSQILERRKLISDITRLSSILKGSLNARGSRAVLNRARQQGVIRQVQQRLTNLIARYQF